jgi:hypothetical protein
MKLWQAWWIGGALLVVLTAVLVWATERAYAGGEVALGGLASLARVAIYVVWLLAVWRCSRNTGRPAWTYVARSLAIVGLIASAVLY